IAFEVFCTLRVAGKIRYRYSMRILTAACPATITAAALTRWVVYFGTISYKLTVLSHLLPRYLGYSFQTSLLYVSLAVA
ncbi:MAG: hypothetical protein ACXV6K_09155, partial [Halobacteriota archaeon]